VDILGFTWIKVSLRLGLADWAFPKGARWCLGFSNRADLVTGCCPIGNRPRGHHPGADLDRIEEHKVLQVSIKFAM
jgi:hypothetical protein